MTNRKSYRVAVDGCDDSTYVDVLLTEREAALVRQIAEAVTEASSYGCMPTMTLIDPVEAAA